MSFLPISRITVTIEIGVLMSAILVLEFEAGMADAEFSLQPLLDRALDLFNLRPPLGCHDDMAVERSLVLLHLPEMDVVDVGDAFDFPHRFDDGLVVDVRRAPEHQGSDWAAYFSERQIQG